MIGGNSEPKTLRMVAQYGDESNLTCDVSQIPRKLEALDEHCQKLGRNRAISSHQAGNARHRANPRADRSFGSPVGRQPRLAGEHDRPPPTELVALAGRTADAAIPKG